MFDIFKDNRSASKAIARKLGSSTLTIAREVNTIIKRDVFSIKAVPKRVITPVL